MQNIKTYFKSGIPYIYLKYIFKNKNLLRDVSSNKEMIENLITVFI